jgi:hypothetical protein
LQYYAVTALIRVMESSYPDMQEIFKKALLEELMRTGSEYLQHWKAIQDGVYPVRGWKGYWDVLNVAISYAIRVGVYRRLKTAVGFHDRLKTDLELRDSLTRFSISLARCISGSPPELKRWISAHEEKVLSQCIDRAIAHTWKDVSDSQEMTDAEEKLFDKLWTRDGVESERQNRFSQVEQWIELDSAILPPDYVAENFDWKGL